MRDIKWHAYNTKYGSSLCWSENETEKPKILEFDTKKDIEVFLGSMTCYKEFDNLIKVIEIKEDIVYHDNGYYNVTGKILKIRYGTR